MSILLSYTHLDYCSIHKIFIQRPFIYVLKRNMYDYFTKQTQLYRYNISQQRVVNYFNQRLEPFGS